MEARAWHRKYEDASWSQQARHLFQDRLEVVDVLEYRVGEHPIEASITLGDVAAPHGVHCCIDSKRLRCGCLFRIRVDSDQLTPAGTLQHDAGEQTVAAAEIEAPTFG